MWSSFPMPSLVSICCTLRLFPTREEENIGVRSPSEMLLRPSEQELRRRNFKVSVTAADGLQRHVSIMYNSARRAMGAPSGRSAPPRWCRCAITPVSTWEYSGFPFVFFLFLFFSLYRDLFVPFCFIPCLTQLMMTGWLSLADGKWKVYMCPLHV